MFFGEVVSDHGGNVNSQTVFRFIPARIFKKKRRDFYDIQGIPRVSP